MKIEAISNETNSRLSNNAKLVCALRLAKYLSRSKIETCYNHTSVTSTYPSVKHNEEGDMKADYYLDSGMFNV